MIRVLEEVKRQASNVVLEEKVEAEVVRTPDEKVELQGVLEWDFRKDWQKVPSYAFTVKIGANTYRVKGSGEDDYGHIIKSGTFGRVFIGVNIDTGEKVALKVAAPLPFSRKMFRNECQALLDVRGHQNVVSANHVGLLAGNSPLMFAVMDFIDGAEGLIDFIEKGESFTAREVFSIIRDVAKGLKHSHRSGWIHRDVKLGNILFGSDGVARLCDFGLCYSSEPGKRANFFSGSPIGFSPESLMRKSQGPKSDVYGLMATFASFYTNLKIEKKIGNPIGYFSGDKVLSIFSENNPRLRGDIVLKREDLLYSSKNLCKNNMHLEPVVDKVLSLINRGLKLDPDERISLDEIIQELEGWIAEEAMLPA